MSESQIRKMGWKPDLPDHRDHRYSLPLSFLGLGPVLPPSVDLRPHFVKPFDQGDLGSCVANATAAALMFDRAKQGLEKFMPSRLFIYYNARAAEGLVKEDSGTTIRMAVKTIVQYGFAHESKWKYIESKFKTKPTPAVYADGKIFSINKYSRIDNTKLDLLKACLADGYPIILGYSLYENFYDADKNGGIVPMPGESRLLGGHCVLCVGYDDATKRFIIRNSWGIDAGDQGYYYMPYDYLTNPELADDFWTIRSVTENGVDNSV